MIAQVAVSCAVFSMDQPYSYRIPEQLSVLPGMRVSVPFGRANRRTEAMVLAVADGPTEKLKAIESVLDAAPVMDEEQLRLAAFIRERYFCTYYDAVKAILPAGLWFRQEKILRIRDDAGDWAAACAGRETEAALLALLEDFGGSAPESALLAQMPDQAAAEAAVGWEQTRSFPGKLPPESRNLPRLPRRRKRRPMQKKRNGRRLCRRPFWSCSARRANAPAGS